MGFFKKGPDSLTAPSMDDRQREYYEAFGVFPPLISDQDTPDNITDQIAAMKHEAETTLDIGTASQLVREIAYLSGVRVEKTCLM